MKVAILQQLYPHYREAFFKELSNKYNMDYYTYQERDTLNKFGFNPSNIKANHLSNFYIANKLRVFNFIPLLSKKYDVIVLPAEIRSLSIWILLILGKFTSKKIILWGHGISVKNYLEEEKKLNPLRVVFHKLSDHNWLYTKKEKNIWSKYIIADKITALNNSIDTKEILNLPALDKEEMKKKYKISTTLNLIYCARFTANRRIDLMLEVIKKFKDKDIGFIIIGEGDYKPDFSNHKHVYDFGAVYNEDVKHALFTIADLYFQPAWTGLSIVEAMAYGKPILTFERNKDILQCVEYSYIKHSRNGYIAKSVNDLITYIRNIDNNELEKLQAQTKEYAKFNFGIELMISNVKTSLRKLSI